MHKVFALFKAVILVSCILALCACPKKNPDSEFPVPYAIPSSSPFSKIKLGWTMRQVRETIGPPTDTRTYTAGLTSYLPIYSGDTGYRADEHYKGHGFIVYAGSSDTGIQSYQVLRIVYNEEESGYADKSAYPDGPHNKPPTRKPPKPRPVKTPVSTQTATQVPGSAQAPPQPQAPASQPDAGPDILDGL